MRELKSLAGSWAVGKNGRLKAGSIFWPLILARVSACHGRREARKRNDGESQSRSLGKFSRIFDKGHTELRQRLAGKMNSSGTMAFRAAQQQQCADSRQ